jgi:murein peptide amidase A
MEPRHHSSLGLQRLGRNVTCYSGDTIDIDSVVGECVAAAQGNGWAVEEICSSPKRILALTRQERRPAGSGGRRLRVYISSGIHGDEPAGPLAVRQLLQENAWPGDLELWLCPCLNPLGFMLNRRENSEGIDLNRQYLEPTADEIVAHIEWLKRQPTFDLCLCLHEDWEAHGFYVYELNPDDRPSLAEPMVAAVAKVCPIDRSEVIEGRPAHEGVIRPSADPRARPQWPEAFFLLTHKTRLSYTLEAPSDFPLPARVAALVAGVQAALERMMEP